MERSTRSVRPMSGRRASARLLVAAMAAAAAAWMACGPISEPIEFSFSVIDTSFDSLPPTGDQFLYKYRGATIKPDSAIRAILNARIPLNEAWQPKEDICASTGDPIGPRFTVLIDDPDTRLESHGFEPGNGIRPCTRRILRFTIQRSFF